MSDKTNALTSAVDDFAAKAATKKQADGEFISSQANVESCLQAVKDEADQIALNSNQSTPIPGGAA